MIWYDLFFCIKSLQCMLVEFHRVHLFLLPHYILLWLQPEQLSAEELADPTAIDQLLWGLPSEEQQIVRMVVS